MMLSHSRTAHKPVFFAHMMCCRCRRFPRRRSVTRPASSRCAKELPTRRRLESMRIPSASATRSAARGWSASSARPPRCRLLYAGCQMRIGRQHGQAVRGRRIVCPLAPQSCCGRRRRPMRRPSPGPSSAITRSTSGPWPRSGWGQGDPCRSPRKEHRSSTVPFGGPQR